MVSAADKPAEANLLWEKNTIPWLISSSDRTICVGASPPQSISDPAPGNYSNWMLKKQVIYWLLFSTKFTHIGPILVSSPLLLSHLNPVMPIHKFFLNFQGSLGIPRRLRSLTLDVLKMSKKMSQGMNPTYKPRDNRSITKYSCQVATDGVTCIAVKWFVSFQIKAPFACL